VEFQFASRASQGARSYQEDSVAVRAGPDGEGAGGTEGRAAELTAALADGMGGHVGGAMASQTVCRTFLAAYGTSTGTIVDRLHGAMSIANEAIASAVVENPALSGMGCTLVGASFSAPGLAWVSVGDSPMFLIRRGEIQLLNEDHSLAPEIDKLAAAGKITLEEAESDPRRHFLRSALTGTDIDLVDHPQKPLTLEPDDIVVLASDGIQTLGPTEILRVVSAYAAEGPKAIVDALIRTVEAAREPYQDNTTVVAVRVAA
jgi:PPM family protein phosphatase